MKNGIYAFALILFAQDSNAWTMLGEFEITIIPDARALTTTRSPASESGMYDYAQSYAYIKESGSIMDDQLSPCPRFSNFEIECLATAQDITLETNCEYCAGGDGKVRQTGVFMDEGSWGEWCDEYVCTSCNWD